MKKTDNIDGDKRAAMREGGRLLGEIRNRLVGLLRPGLDLMEIETRANEMIKSAGAIPNFATVDNYGFATCLMVNEEVVHCRPKKRVIREGDLVTLDIGLEWRGWQLDTADSRLVGREDDRFLSCGREALARAINAARPGNRIGRISAALEKVIKKGGYGPVKKYCGHGIGRKIHERPSIFCYHRFPIEDTMLIKKEMTLAIEVMMNEGLSEVVISQGGWRSVTADGSRSLQLEHTVWISENGAEILTK